MIIIYLDWGIGKWLVFVGSFDGAVDDVDMTLYYYFC